MSMTNLPSLPPKAQNAVRADWARQAVDFFGEETFNATFAETVIEQPDVGDDAYCMVQDLIGNLLHLAVQHGWDPEELLTRARGNFDHENDPGYAGD